VTTEYLGQEDLLALADDLGVSKVRDLGPLDAAAHRPGTSLFGHEAYPTLHDRAVVLVESITRNDPSSTGTSDWPGWPLRMRLTAMTIGGFTRPVQICRRSPFMRTRQPLQCAEKHTAKLRSVRG
jgi:hypothetical protein